MKFYPLIAAASLAILLPSCDKKDPAIKEKVDDALDRRPNEKLKDAGEDIKDGVKDAGKEIKEGVKDATR